MRARIALGALTAFALATTAGAASAEPAEAPASTSPLALGIVPGESGGPWTMRVQNTGELPVRLAADPRLLVLQVTPPAEASPPPRAARRGRPADPTITCSLPADARPDTDEGQELVVPAKRSWSAKFDPLLYCFDERARGALVPGAVVHAWFGWPSRAAKTVANGRSAKASEPGPPFVAAPVGAAVGKVPAAKAVEAPPVTLTNEQRVSAAPPLPPVGTSGSSGSSDTAGLALAASAAIDASRGVELPVTLTLANEADRPATLVFRPEMVRFRVATPAGTIACGASVERASPIRELFTTVAPRGRTQLTVLLAATCPADTFDSAGLYRATAILDTSLASGRSIGLRTFDGVVTAKTPTLVRVRTATRPASAKRPVLD